MIGEIVYYSDTHGRTYREKPPPVTRVRPGDPIGTAGRANPDGTVPVILNDYGRSLFGPFTELVILPPEPEADVPHVAHEMGGEG